MFPLEEGVGEPWFPVLLGQRSCTFGLFGLGGLASVLFGGTFLEPIAAASDRDDLGVVQEAIEDRAGGWDIAQELSPFFDWTI